MQITISESTSATVAVVDGQAVMLSNNSKGAKARLEVTSGAWAGKVLSASHAGRAMYSGIPPGNVKVWAIVGSLTYDVGSEAYFRLPYGSVDETGNSTDFSAGTLLRDPDTGRIYGQADGSGGIDPVQPFDAADNPAHASQFALTQSALPLASFYAAATGQAYLGPCAIVGVRAVTLGTGTLTIHDGTAASDAALLRMSRAHTAMVAGTYYPMVSPNDRAALLFDTGAYVTIPAGGLYWLDLIDGTEIPGVAGSGMLCVATRVAASGLALEGPATVVSVKVIAPGSSGNLDIRGGPVVGSTLLYPSTAFGSLAADQIIKLGPDGGGVSVDALYLTIPTGAIVLVNHPPR